MIRVAIRKQKTEDRRQIFMLLCSCALMLLSAGCENADSGKMPLAEQVEKLTQEKTQLQSQVEKSKAENQLLEQQIQTLSKLPDGVKAENIYSVHGIKLTRYTNFYDKDKDSKKETLIVYIQPIDQEGDIIKAAGDVDVQLLDLNKKDGPALLGQWRITAQQLKELWFKTLLTVNYRLTFDIADKIKDFKDPLTVTVTFTDYLTGRVFKEQKVIKP